MKALVVTATGGPEVLEWQDLPDPVPGPGEVLVRTRAFAVNWADLLEREGRYPGGPEPPFVGGHDLVGDVVAHGPGVDGPPIGCRVFGPAPTGRVTAELAPVRAEWLHPVPEGITDEVAAGLAAPYFTADAALVTMGRLQAGESVLVHAAAGAFGSAAVQLARAYGAGQIIATAGTDEKLQHVKEWGADVLVNYTTGDFVDAVSEATGGQGVDLVIESVGAEVLERSFDCVRPTGRIISVGASAGRSTSRFRLHTLFEKGIVVGGFTLGLWLLNQPELVAPSAARVLDLLERGELAPAIGGVFSAADVAEAHRFLQDRRSIGRTVVRLDPSATTAVEA
jgi:NADPH2:quinone reductase